MEDCKGGEVIVSEALRNTGLPGEERDEIYRIVSALTKDDTIPGKRERLEDTLRRIHHAPCQAILIKLCDRMDNLIDSRDQDQEFLSEYLAMTDLLIAGLSKEAKLHGYTDALEQLEMIRADVGFYYEAKFC